jgi:hypothetical protein
MEHITIRKLRRNLRTERIKRRTRQWLLHNEIMDDIVKFLVIASFINIWYHWENLLKIVERFSL